MSDYDTVNDMAWIRKVVQRGPGSDMLDQDPRRVKRRFKLSGAQIAQRFTPGSVVLLDKQKRLIARWHKIGWNAKDAAGHYGHLHAIMDVKGKFVSWPIEKLREGERDGTSSVFAPVGPPGPNDWKYPDGSGYPDVWAVILDGKLDSPVMNRDQSRENYRPPVGSLGAWWVGTWDSRLGIPNRRTDLMPFRYEPVSGGGGSGGGGGGGGGTGGYVAPDDVQLDALAARLRVRAA